MTQFDSDTFEKDYILAVLDHMVTDLKTQKPVEQVLDHYAVELTAFMNGQIRSAVRRRPTERPDVGIKPLLWLLWFLTVSLLIVGYALPKYIVPRYLSHGIITLSDLAVVLAVCAVSAALSMLPFLLGRKR